MLKRYSLLWLAMLYGSLWLASVVIAQTVAVDPVVVENPWAHLLKLVFPVILTAVGPILTGFIKTAPDWVKFIVASIGTTLVGFGAGSIPDFPVYPATGAEIGLGAGATSQAILNGWLKRPEAEAQKT